MAKGASAEKAVREIRRKTRRRFSAEEKVRIVLEGIRGEESIASLCRREGSLRQRCGSIAGSPVRARYHAVSFRCGKSSSGTGTSRKRQMGSQPSPGW